MKRVSQCSKKKASPFIPEHEVEYGIKIYSRSVADGAVTAVVCIFCVDFGREEKVGQKRKPTENAKYFELFRADNYQNAY
jgi:hypothetical protein